MSTSSFVDIKFLIEYNLLLLAISTIYLLLLANSWIIHLGVFLSCLLSLQQNPHKQSWLYCLITQVIIRVLHFLFLFGIFSNYMLICFWKKFLLTQLFKNLCPKIDKIFQDLPGKPFNKDHVPETTWKDQGISST